MLVVDLCVYVCVCECMCARRETRAGLAQVVCVCACVRVRSFTRSRRGTRMRFESLPRCDDALLPVSVSALPSTRLLSDQAKALEAVKD